MAVGALQGLAPERVLYIGSASKRLAPGMRLGWMLMPSWLTWELTAAKAVEDGGSEVLGQLALRDFIVRGELDRHMRRMRTALPAPPRSAAGGARRDGCPRLRLPAPRAARPPACSSSCELPDGVDEPALLRAAAARGVGVEGLSLHRFTAGGPPGVLLGYGNLSEPAIEQGVRLLGEAYAEVDGSVRRRPVAYRTGASYDPDASRSQRRTTSATPATSSTSPRIAVQRDRLAGIPSRPKRSISTEIASWPAITAAVRPLAPRRAHGEDRDRHVDGAEQPADERPPRCVADLWRSRRDRLVEERRDDQQRDGADEERERRGLQAADGLPRRELTGACIPTRQPPRQRREQHGAGPRPHLASSQLRPTPIVHGHRRVVLPHADHLALDQLAGAARPRSGAPSNSSSSWIVRIRRVCSPARASAWWQRTIASLMMSAAVPWMTVLTARRSPSVRTW